MQIVALERGDLGIGVVATLLALLALGAFTGTASAHTAAD